jgi:hypothetical protein
LVATDGGEQETRRIQKAASRRKNVDGRCRVVDVWCMDGILTDISAHEFLPVKKDILLY